MQNFPKVIFIDWYKTLSFSHFWEHLEDQKIENFIFAKENRFLIDSWMRGNFSAEEICQIIANNTNLNFDFIFAELVLSAKKLTLVDKKIPNLISKIRNKGIKTIVATGNMDTFRRFTIPSLKLENIFDDFLISSELGLMKFETEENKIPFFEKYLQGNNLKYSDVVLLDDKTDKTGVYEKLGFKIEKIDSTKKLLKLLNHFSNHPLYT